MGRGWCGKSAFSTFRNSVQFCKLKTQARREVPTPPNVASTGDSSSEMTPHLNLCPRSSPRGRQGGARDRLSSAAMPSGATATVPSTSSEPLQRRTAYRHPSGGGHPSLWTPRLTALTPFLRQRLASPYIPKPEKESSNPLPIFLPGKSHELGRLVGLQSTGSQRYGPDCTTSPYFTIPKQLPKLPPECRPRDHAARLGERPGSSQL